MLEKVPAAADVMLSPLGSPTIIPTSGRMLSSKLESDSRKIVFVAPQSWIGRLELSPCEKLEFIEIPVAAGVLWPPLGSPAAVSPSVIRIWRFLILIFSKIVLVALLLSICRYEVAVFLILL